MKNFDNLNFNLRLYVQAYRKLGYPTNLDDWNVRCSPNRLVLDNHASEFSATISVEEEILEFQFRPWRNPDGEIKIQNIDLCQINSGWRNSYFGPDPSPSPEAVAFLEHLISQGYLERQQHFENESFYDDMDIPCY